MVGRFNHFIRANYVVPVALLCWGAVVRGSVYRNPAGEKVLCAEPRFRLTRVGAVAFAAFSVLVVYVVSAAALTKLRLERRDV